MRREDMRIDVSERLGLAGSHETAISIFLPEVVSDAAPPPVIFVFPGGGYGRLYYDLPRPGYSQAAYHVARGAIVVACDHLGTGDSTEVEPDLTTFELIATANQGTTEAVRARLESGTLIPGLPPLDVPLWLGVGQSAGGMFLTVQQALYRSFDGVGLLGWSGLHTVVPFPPGYAGPDRGHITRADVLRYAFHWEDEAEDLLDADCTRSPVPPWASLRLPHGQEIKTIQDEGVAARWAEVIEVPVFIGTGERDVCVDPRREPSAYRSSRDITVCVVPRMAHMHNFARTREQLWKRLDAWLAGLS